MLECLARRRDVLRNQREALLEKIQNGETGDPLDDVFADLWDVRSRLIVYGDFEIMDDPPADFVEMWKGIENENSDGLKRWINQRIATADRIISKPFEDLSDADNDLLKKQGIAVKNELKIARSLIGGMWFPKIVFAWKGDSE